MLEVLAALTVVLAQASSAQESSSLAFRWPAEGAVRVHEMRQERGVSVGLDYVLRWAPAEPAGQRIVRTTDVVVGSIESLDPDIRVTPWRRADVTTIVGTLPALRVDEHGEPLGCVDVEASGRRSAAAACANRGDALCSGLSRLTEFASVRETAEQRAIEAWTACCAVWIGWTPEPGAIERTTFVDSSSRWVADDVLWASGEHWFVERSLRERTRELLADDGRVLTARTETVRFYEHSVTPLDGPETLSRMYEQRTRVEATFERATLRPRTVTFARIPIDSSGVEVDDPARSACDRRLRTFAFDWNAPVPAEPRAR